VSELVKPYCLSCSGSSLAELADSLRDIMTHCAKISADHWAVFLRDQAQQKKTHRAQRVFFLADDPQSLIQDVKQFYAQRSHWQEIAPKQRLFLMTGQGSQFRSMGKELAQVEPFFKETMDYVDRVFQQVMDVSLLSLIDSEDDPLPIDQTGITQPALYAIEYALATLWQHWGICPDVVMGHSVGEFVAAQVAGVFSFEDGLKLIAERARLMQALPAGGGMLAVMSDLSSLQSTLGDGIKAVDVAALNGPSQTVLSGPLADLDLAAQTLKDNRVKSRSLTVSHAFHSRLMDPMLFDLSEVAQTLSYHAPALKIMSNVTGHMADENTYDASYWVNHVRQPVQFYPCMQRLEADHRLNQCIEIGPQPVLIGMAKRCVADSASMDWLPSIKRGSEASTFFNSLKQAYQTVSLA
jgi:phthiocerol/phenolphthiocerol synthesis type-I polyketide synthase C